MDWLDFFVLSFAGFLAGIVLQGSEFKAMSSTLPSGDLSQFGFAFTIELFDYIVFGWHTLLPELSCIRSIYKFSKHETHGTTDACYIISADLAFAALVFRRLIFFGAIDLIGETGSVKLQENVLMLAGLPIIIISFILGSIPSKHAAYVTDKDDNLNISLN